MAAKFTQDAKVFRADAAGRCPTESLTGGTDVLLPQYGSRSGLKSPRVFLKQLDSHKSIFVG
jgi:hypothetical protein